MDLRTLILLLSAIALAVQSQNIELRMPKVKPERNDEYLCHSVKLEGTDYLIGYTPHAEKEIAHHMLLYGCTEPGAQEDAWNCAEMESSNAKSGSVCASGTSIVYAWAMDAPLFRMPADTAYKVGDGTQIKYLVLQVHYKNVTKFKKSDITDNSGFTIKYQKTPTSRLTGMYLMLTDGVIPGNSIVHMDAMCSYNGKANLHPMAYRVHTHKHGVVVSGYRVRDGEWTELGRMSPQKPQMFYHSTHPEATIKPGDSLAARCVMKNMDDVTVKIGNTQNDEMCNFYLMYWIDARDAAQLSDEANSMCTSEGFPSYQWFDSIARDSIPKLSFSDPLTNELLNEDIDRDFFEEAVGEMMQDRDNMEEEMRDDLI